MIVGIIGAGTMGSGIAQAFAQCEGFEVRLCDITAELALRGKGRIENQLMKRVQKGKMDAAAAEAILNRITTGTKDICSDCDLIVEAAFESMDVKKQTFEELQAIAKPTCIFASNTSSLSITEIGAKLDRPLVGMHFFNPAPVMKLVEIIAGINTPRKLVDQVKAIAVGLGKTPVEVNEAVGVYAEGVASAEDIDTAMKLGANHPIGPLALGDMIGLDVVLAIMEVLQSETGDPKYRPHPLLRKMVRGGLLGVKSGQGFFTYSK